MNVNRGKMTAAAVLAVTLLVVGGVTGYGLYRAGTVGQPFCGGWPTEGDGQLLSHV